MSPLGEADTRAKLIDPALHARGWTEDLIRREETAGAVEILGERARRRPRGRVDYTLRIKVNAESQAVAVALLEAKAEHLPPAHGLEQAKAGIGYMVTGSMALNYYAVPRMTRDIDVVVELSAGDAERLVALFHDDFYIDPEAVRGAIDQRGTFNAIHTDSVVKVDFVVRKESEYRRTEFSRRRRASVEGHEFFIVAPEDLILSKLDWARNTRSEVQVADVRSLLASANTSAGDTSPEVARAFRAMLLRRPPEERLKMGCSMHAAAQALVKESVLASVPLAAAATLRQALFLRFYGHEFDSEARERVLARLAMRSRHPAAGGGWWSR